MHALRPAGCTAAAVASPAAQRSCGVMACAAPAARRAATAVRVTSVRCRRARSGRSGVVSQPRAASDDDGNMSSSKDTKGAGATFISPGWLTALQRNWGDAAAAGVPRADAKPDDVADLLGGALFLALFKWFKESGPVYLLPTGPISSFLVISDPAAAKHVLRGYPDYGKGLVREVSEFLFGTGFAIAEGDLWKGRRRAVVPSLHKAYLETMVRRVFDPCTRRLEDKLAAAAASGKALDVESCFSQLTLDIIGLSVFNYDYNSLTAASPVIQAVYTALKETEQRATDLLPIWKVPILCLFSERQRKAANAVAVIRKTTEELIQKCKAMVESEQEFIESGNEEYINAADPSVLRFLLASRVEVTEAQLRDDLLSMLVAGHETTASVLTWTLKLLVDNPAAMAKAQAEADRVLGGRSADSPVTMADTQALQYCMRCLNESMRLYPHPPVLIRRASTADTLPGGFAVPANQDIIISVYNIHHSPAVWDRAEEFLPERFPLDEPIPNETNTDYKYIPFSGGPRKCVGDMFALLEAVTALAMVLHRFDFALVPNQDIGITTGATIHTLNGLFMTVKDRKPAPAAAAA